MKAVYVLQNNFSFPNIIIVIKNLSSDSCHTRGFGVHWHISGSWGIRSCRGHQQLLCSEEIISQKGLRFFFVFSMEEKNYDSTRK